MSDPQLLRTFRFKVKLRKSAALESGAAGTDAAPAAQSGEPLGDGAFQECSGLEIEMDVQQLEEGGRNDGVIRRVGRARYQNIVLKRGMLHSGGEVNRELWLWLQSVLAGERPVPRYDGVVEVMHVGDRDIVAKWEFDRGLPAKVVGPALNAKTGEIAIEELHIAHEGLRLAEL